MGHNMTIEEMIAANAPWDQIRARINELQREQKRKEMEAAKQAEKAQEAAVARDRFINAFIDWLIIEEVLTEADRTEFSPIVIEACDDIVMELRQIKMLAKLYNKIK